MKKWVVVFLSMLCMISGCGAGSSTDGNPETQPFFTGIEVDDTDPIQPGLPFDIIYSLTSDTDFEGEKTVSFYLLNNEIEAAGEDIEDPVEHSFYLDSVQLTVLPEGESSFSMSVMLPEDMPFSGLFYIVGMVADTSEEENGYDDVISSEEISVDLSTQETTNIILTDFTLDDTNVVIDDDSDIDTSDSLSQPYHGNSDLFGNLTMNSFNTAAENILVRVMIWVDGTWENIEIWDGDAAGFSDSLLVSLEERLENQSIGLDLNFPEALVQKVHAHASDTGDNQFTIRAHVDPEDEVAEVSEEDNYLDAEVQLFLFPMDTASVGGVSFNKSFSPTIGSRDYCAVKSEFEFGTGVNTLPTMAATASTRFKLTPMVLKKELGLAQIDLNANYSLLPSDRGVTLAVKWQGKKVFDKPLYGSNLTATFEKDWYKETLFFQTKVLVGPVPVNFSTGAKGGVGFRFDLGVKDHLYVNGRLPRLDLGVFGRGGVGVLGWEAGVEVNGVLAEVDCAATAEVNINSDSADINTEAFYDLSLLSARMGLYATKPEVKWCKKWRVSYPCGVGTSRPFYFWLLENTKGYRKKATLVHKDFTWNP